MTPAPELEGSSPARRKAASISDVARLAEVSPQTVSRVSRGSEKVKPETRKRVLAAMAQLGYSPNLAARALRGGSFHIIGLLTQQVARTGEAHTISGVLDAARERGLAAVVSQVAHPDAEEVHTALVDLARQPIEGLVIVQSGRASVEHLALPPNLAVASSDSALVGYFPSASADQVQGVRDAVEHLLTLGHRTVHHITGPLDSQAANVRRSAWAQTLQRHGCEVPEPLPGDWSVASGYAAIRRLLEGPTPSQTSGASVTSLPLSSTSGATIPADFPTAIFCANDETAIGAIAALREAGLEVPRDVSIVGFDGVDYGAFITPPLTTIEQDFHRAGREMVALVAEQIEDGIQDGSRHIVIPTRLVIRGTTAPPRS